MPVLAWIVAEQEDAAPLRQRLAVVEDALQGMGVGVSARGRLEGGFRACGI